VEGHEEGICQAVEILYKGWLMMMMMVQFGYMEVLRRETLFVLDKY